MGLFTRVDRLRSAADRLRSTPLLLEGDADEIIGVLRAGALEAGLAVESFSTWLANEAEKAHFVILAIISDGRQSSLVKATELMTKVSSVVASDAVRLAVVQSDRLLTLPPRLQRRLGIEILYQLTLAVPELATREHWRNARQRAALAGLEAAGLRILRLA